MEQQMEITLIENVSKSELAEIGPKLYRNRTYSPVTDEEKI